MKKYFLTEVAKRKQEFRKKLEAMQPPPDVSKYIKDQTEKTAECNKSNSTFDKDSFRLGLHIMWIYLFQKGMIKKDENL